jgi:hypothetical protein
MLQKGFLKDKYKIEISKRRFWLSVLLGLGTTLGLYIFFCAFRLVFRIMDFDIGNGPLIYGESSRFWQNLNFAMLSSVLGNSIFLGYLFKKPTNAKLPSYKRISIQNNQSFLGFGFFSIFAQCFFIAGLVSAVIFDPMMFSAHTWLFVLIALTLFLENWTTIIRLFRGRALKKMIFNLIALAGLTLLLATTSIVNYQKMDAVMLTQNPPVDVPESTFKSVPKAIYGKTLKMLYEGEKVKYQLNGRFMNFEELKDDLKNNNRDVYYYSHRKGIYLYVEKSIPMSEVWKVQDELFSTERYRITYVTSLPKPMYTGRFERMGIEKFLSISAHARLLADGMPQPPYYPWPGADFIRSQNIVKVQIDKGFVSGGKRLKKEDLLPFFMKTIDSTTLFYFKYDETVSFEDYLTLYGNYKQAVFELRKEDELIRVDANEIFMGTVNWRNYSREAYNKDQERLREKYPVRYIENYEFEFPD